jgi:hypothetical protein
MKNHRRDEEDKHEQQIDHFLSTSGEIRRAVERNAIDRGTLFIGIIVELRLDELLNQVDRYAQVTDKEEIAVSAEQLGIDIEALRVLDSDEPPIPYPYYFCTPDFLIEHPQLTFYYRNIAMLSSKVMRGVGLDTTPYENGETPTRDEAIGIVKYLNEIVSGLLIETGAAGVTRNRHIQMVMANLGDSLGGSSRNEVGRVAMAHVMRRLIKHLHRRGWLDRIVYTLRESLVPGTGRGQDIVLDIEPQVDIGEKLDEIEAKYVKYKEVHLSNGVELLVDKQITWYDSSGKKYNPTADLHSDRGESVDETEMIWGAEVKGGADPAGSDEHWKTASRALARILEDALESGHEKPPLSFIGTTIVKKVAVEIKAWMERGDLVSAYNLTKIMERPEFEQQFLDDMTVFLGYDG